ncbi:hypothetical protein [Halomarina pelagica]|uniref:hypothetical protein n=1 Tax=Halomarina pelagica TaxID=2961599 RepID=UPI0020C4E529|nr:hypothetical protein [Halomarina sp. BND7]
MNVFVYVLAEDEVDPAPDKTSTKFVVDDNVGESIHVHLRNLRLEMGVRDFDTFASQLRDAREELHDGDR